MGVRHTYQLLILFLFISRLASSSIISAKNSYISSTVRADENYARGH